jgi:hypothetical protein
MKEGQTLSRTGRVGWKRHESVYLVLTGSIALRIPAGARDSPLLQNVQTGSEAHLVGTGGSFPEDKAAGA